MTDYYNNMKAQWANYPGSVATPQEANAFYVEMGLKPVAEYLNPLLAQVEWKHNRVLDFGCDNGVMLNYFTQPGLELHGVDINEAAITAGQALFPQFTLQAFNGLQLPYPNDHFDLVFASAVLKHIRFEDRNTVYAELKRITRYLMVFDVNAPENHTETFEGFTFYHTNFTEELPQHFTPIQEILEKDQLFGLYQTPQAH